MIMITKSIQTMALSINLKTIMPKMNIQKFWELSDCVTQKSVWRHRFWRRLHENEIGEVIAAAVALQDPTGRDPIDVTKADNLL